MLSPPATSARGSLARMRALATFLVAVVALTALSSSAQGQVPQVPCTQYLNTTNFAAEILTAAKVQENVMCLSAGYYNMTDLDVQGVLPIYANPPGESWVILRGPSDGSKAVFFSNSSDYQLSTNFLRTTKTIFIESVTFSDVHAYYHINDTEALFHTTSGNIHLLDCVVEGILSGEPVIGGGGLVQFTNVEFRNITLYDGAPVVHASTGWLKGVTFEYINAPTSHGACVQSHTVTIRNVDAHNVIALSAAFMYSTGQADVLGLYVHNCTALEAAAEGIVMYQQVMSRPLNFANIVATGNSGDGSVVYLDSDGNLGTEYLYHDICIENNAASFGLETCNVWGETTNISLCNNGLFDAYCVHNEASYFNSRMCGDRFIDRLDYQSCSCQCGKSNPTSYCADGFLTEANATKICDTIKNNTLPYVGYIEPQVIIETQEILNYTAWYNTTDNSTAPPVDNDANVTYTTTFTETTATVPDTNITQENGRDSSTTMSFNTSWWFTSSSSSTVDTTSTTEDDGGSPTSGKAVPSTGNGNNGVDPTKALITAIAVFVSAFCCFVCLGLVVLFVVQRKLDDDDNASSIESDGTQMSNLSVPSNTGLVGTNGANPRDSRDSRDSGPEFHSVVLDDDAPTMKSLNSFSGKIDWGSGAGVPPERIPTGGPIQVGAGKALAPKGKEVNRKVSFRAKSANEARGLAAAAGGKQVDMEATIAGGGGTKSLQSVDIRIDQSINIIDLKDPSMVFVRHLGEGCYGDVDQYQWNFQDVAVKVMKELDAAAVQEFVEEAQVLATLRSQSCVQYIGISVNPLAIITEFMPNGDLKDFLHPPPNEDDGTSEAPSLDLRHGIVLDIAGGLVYLHSLGVPHRDLKPANILLTRHNEAKLADFGLAGNKQMNIDGAGTWRYAAPEVLLGKTGDIKSDVFSFGCVVFETLTLKKPYATNALQRSTDPHLVPDTLAEFTFEDERVPDMLRATWAFEPSQRPDIVNLLPLLKELWGHIR